MKVCLVVLTQGKYLGKEIPIAQDKFIIGRDAQCNLRPASQLISKRHCGLFIRDDRVFVQDFASTNGTFVNDEPIKGEIALANEDRLTVGPLTFRIMLRKSVAVDERTPLPVNKKTQPEVNEEDMAATLLLSSVDQPPAAHVDEQGVPLGSTVLDSLPQPPPSEGPKEEVPNKEQDKSAEDAKAEKSREEKAKAADADTSAAANAILTKYLRRPRHSREDK
jgi:pSer/pThr/pTyr-binding forkhead associated (FHA) protein